MLPPQREKGIVAAFVGCAGLDVVDGGEGNRNRQGETADDVELSWRLWAVAGSLAGWRLASQKVWHGRTAGHDESQTTDGRRLIETSSRRRRSRWDGLKRWRQARNDDEATKKRKIKKRKKAGLGGGGRSVGWLCGSAAAAKLKEAKRVGGRCTTANANAAADAAQ